eukprot:6484904-Amphidinium_carterae.2
MDHDDDDDGANQQFTLGQHAAPTKKRKGRPPKVLQQLCSGELEMPSVGAIESDGNFQLLDSSNNNNATSGCRSSGASTIPAELAKMPFWVPGFDLMSFYSNDFFAAVSLCRSALSASVEAVQKDGAHTDQDYVKLHQSYIATDSSYHCSSVIALSEKLDISRPLLLSKFGRLASAHVVALKGQKLLLDEFFIKRLHSGQLCVHLESVAYDETPLPTTSKLISEPAGPNTDCDEEMLPFSLASNSLGPMKADTISAKVLQTKGQYGYVKFIGACTCPLQVLSNTTGPVLMEALLRSSWTSSFGQNF